MMRWLLLLMLSSWAPRALAEVCDDDGRGLLTGPVSFSLLPGERAEPHRACPRSGVFAGVDGQAVIRPSEFYGNLQGGVVFGGSTTFGDRLELFGALEPLFAQQVISSLRATHIGGGHGSLGAMLQLKRTGSLALSIMTRTTVPLPYGPYLQAWPVGLDVGPLLSLEVRPNLMLHGGAIATGSVVLSRGPWLPRAGLLGYGGAEVALTPWLTLVADAQVLTLYTNPLDYLSAQAALRAGPWGPLGIELYASAPLAGANRTLAGGGLRVSYRL
ncbi:MAG: hypothetical protein ACO3JL_01085 [Myxococcota bacterium]